MRQSLTLILTLLIYFSAAIFPFNANFAFAQSLEDDSNEPKITIQTPINQTYTSGNITLNFTITEPASWFKNYYLSAYPNMIVTYGRVISVGYILDGLQSENISVTEPEVWAVNFGTPNSPVNKTFSFNLTDVPSGQHSLQIIAYSSVYVSGGTSKNSDGPYSPVVTTLEVTDASVDFTIADKYPLSPEGQVLQNYWVVAFMFVIISIAAIIIIHKKRRSAHPASSVTPFLSG